MCTISLFLTAIGIFESSLMDYSGLETPEIDDYPEEIMQRCRLTSVVFGGVLSAHFAPYCGRC